MTKKNISAVGDGIVTYCNFTLYCPPNNATCPILKNPDELTYHFVT